VEKYEICRSSGFVPSVARGPGSWSAPHPRARRSRSVVGLPGLCAQGLDGTVKGGLGEPPMDNTDPAEVPVTAGVHEVEGQLLVGEAAQGLDDRRTQDLLRGHSAGPGGVLCTASEVLPDHVGDGRNGIQYVADPAELLIVRVVDVGDQQVHLNSSFFAHFEEILSFLSCVILDCWCFLYNTLKRVLSTSKCAFLLISLPILFSDGH